ncbi:hypothetical protein [Arthrobacter sp. H14-L1]|uniref:hypothetical protein n=1 Tax=Arthrobacter sp. H14-L1 TaxID=2996697 RepID=UPI00226E674D|nr:hypothetical protein [Arthrobacter sp. H14-L1]
MLDAEDDGVLPPANPVATGVVEPPQPASPIAAAVAVRTVNIFACPRVIIEPDLPLRLPESISATACGAFFLGS